MKTAFLDTPARCQTFLIRGVRGCDKTVLMTALSKEIAENSDWICVDLKSSQNLIDDLSYRLIDACESATGILNIGVDISVAGFGLGIGSKNKRDSVSKCEEILTRLQKHNKKLLISL